MDEFDMVELAFPTVFDVGTKVKIIKITNNPYRLMPNVGLVGKIGKVIKHRNHHETYWTQVAIGGFDKSYPVLIFDFLTCELRKFDYTFEIKLLP